uniref:Histidine biosynthesis trifunctional protein n=1 Tax=Arcella intermedia TaxID=1963864 RepID=A0A6B2KWK4_9EUKA
MSSGIPKERLIYAVEANATTLDLIPRISSKVSALSLRRDPNQPLDLPLIKQIKTLAPHLDLSLRGISSEQEAQSLAQLSVKCEIVHGSLDYSSAFLQTLVTDRPDQLYTTVVVDEQGVALGLVYSSKDSIKEAIKQRRGIYHSRTRGLWPKGETSGATQDLLRVKVDCDGDCLCFVVHQHGSGFCHKNVRTCFGPEGGLGKLARVLESRRNNPQEGSYTNRLFNDAPLLNAKLREEVEELIEAKEKNDIAWEAADVIYFTMVAAVKAGVSLTDIEQQLESRAKKITRRKGDAKPGALKEEVKAKFSSLQRKSPSEILLQPKMDPVDPGALKIATKIVEEIRRNGEEALIHYATTLGDIPKGGKLTLSREDLKSAFDNLPKDQQELLERSAERVRKFAQSQRDTILDLYTPIEGGYAGHTVAAVDSAGCYAPGGRYPLPSSVLMTAITARVAGVKNVWVASPKPVPLTIAAAYVSGCDGFLQVGGAQAIAALAYGAGPVPAVDAIVGPGNKFVTAAKSVLSGVVKIDMLAGPSEVLVIADGSADPAVVAADLIAQAEHDPDASAILITVKAPGFAKQVDEELVKQLLKLETEPIANLSLLNNSFAVDAETLEEAFEISDKIGPEHLELHIKDANNYIHKLNHYGSLFVGNMSAEVLGDYCAGPNHVLPTRGTACYVGGLSVFTFLRVRTWLSINPDETAANLIKDARQLGTLEGLHGHAAASKIREPKAVGKRVWDNDTVLKELVRPDFADLPAYAPIKPLDVLSEELGIPLKALVKLDANENPYGPIPEILEALKNGDVYHIYPDPGQTYLRRAIAERHGISPEQVVAGTGADDLLELIIKLAPPRRPLLISSPTFGMYSFLGSIDRRQIIDVPRNSQNFAVDVEAVIATAHRTNAAIIFLTSPNNPTGNLLPRPDLIKILDSVPRAFIALDEAYIEFLPSATSVDLLAKYPQLIILRTFSKWAAIAGLRVGYAICHPQIARCFDTIKQPYNVNVAADYAARVALQCELKVQKEQVHKIIEARGTLYSIIAGCPFLKAYPDSASNFILMDVLKYPAWLLSSYLRQKGILLRYYTSSRLIRCIRISVGKPEDNLKFGEAVEEFGKIDHFQFFNASGILLDSNVVFGDVPLSRDVLEVLAKKYKVALISNGTGDEKLEKSDLKGLVNVVASAPMTPDFLKNVQNQLDVKKCVLVTANKDLVKASHFSAQLSIGLATEKDQNELLNEGALHVANDWKQLLKIFNL